jgi:hypothetical protein
MKKIQIITGVLTAALIAASFAGCGEKMETQDVSALKQEQTQKASQDQRGTIANVVSLDGNQLTVVLADMPGRGGDGSTPPAPPNGGSGPASGPAIDSSGAPGDGSGQSGQGGGKIQFTGEHATYTLSDDVAVMKGTGDNAAEIDLSELKTDDVIRFTTATDDSGNETIDTIVVME